MLQDSGIVPFRIYGQFRLRKTVCGHSTFERTVRPSARCDFMTLTNSTFQGGCACGRVRFSVTGKPKRAGLCHCMTCRKAHGSAFNPFVVFASRDVSIQGALSEWESSPGYIRKFCPNCGSRSVAVQNDEIELSLGSFDSPGQVAPQYESWTIRREPWLTPLQTPQYCQDNPLSD
jgi:hypothetical protein